MAELSIMLSDAKVSVVVTDEQLDQLVIGHCREASRTCLDVLDMANDRETIDEYEGLLAALGAVIAYFGGQPITRPA